MDTSKLLIPLDYTGCAWEVVTAAADLAEKLDAECVLLYVSNVPPGVDPDGCVEPENHSPIRALAYLDEDARNNLEPLANILLERNIKTRLEIRHGDVIQAILGAQKEIGAGMMIMGTHGRKGIQRLIQGSVAEQVIRESPVPVLCIKSQVGGDHPGETAAMRQVRSESEG